MAIREARQGGFSMTAPLQVAASGGKQQTVCSSLPHCQGSGESSSSFSNVEQLPEMQSNVAPPWSSYDDGRIQSMTVEGSLCLSAQPTSNIHSISEKWKNLGHRNGHA
jgi:hypothetical protein